VAAALGGDRDAEFLELDDVAPQRARVDADPCRQFRAAHAPVPLQQF
jgi:hypothetical protein